jgi:hypothetical protein
MRSYLNALTDPPFAADPPIKLNINGRVLGFVVGVGALLLGSMSVVSLFGVFGFCRNLSLDCSFPILGLVGFVSVLSGYALCVVGGFSMYGLSNEGKARAIYGLLLIAFGDLVGLIGYSGYGLGWFIIHLLFALVVYYLIVISRFPGQAPLVPGPLGGYRTPPSPPPPSK